MGFDCSFDDSFIIVKYKVSMSCLISFSEINKDGYFHELEVVDTESCHLALSQNEKITSALLGCVQRFCSNQIRLMEDFRFID